MIGDELTGDALDRAVVEALGPLIERFGVSLSPPTERVHRNGGRSAGWGELGVWMASTWRPRKGDGHRPIGSGDTPLQAVARCIVDLHSAGAPK